MIFSGILFTPDVHAVISRDLYLHHHWHSRWLPSTKVNCLLVSFSILSKSQALHNKGITYDPFLKINLRILIAGYQPCLVLSPYLLR